MDKQIRRHRDSSTGNMPNLGTEGARGELVFELESMRLQP